jgi:hypothetical protein
MIIEIIHLIIFFYVQLQISKIFKLGINEIEDPSYPHNRITYDF